MIVESNLVGLLFTTGFSTRMVWNMKLSISNNDFLSINKVKINTNNIFIYKLHVDGITNAKEGSSRRRVCQLQTPSYC